MVFGEAINLDKGLVPVGGIGNDHIILRRNEEIIKLAEKSQKDLDAKNKVDRNPKTHTEFKIGDYVLTEPKAGKAESKLHQKS